jgi:hypothetical protein
MTIAISRKSAMSDVKGAFPKKPVMVQESYLYTLIAFFNTCRNEGDFYASINTYSGITNL